MTLFRNLLFRNLRQLFGRWWSSPGPSRPAAGDIYSIESGDQFGVVKVLAVEDDIIHVRLFREKFADRPVAVSTGGLTLGRFDDPEGCGIGHLPLSRTVFRTWIPTPAGHEPVEEAELEGYRFWKDDGGGTFG